jgi:hypothetical protein
MGANERAARFSDRLMAPPSGRNRYLMSGVGCFWTSMKKMDLDEENTRLRGRVERRGAGVLPTQRILKWFEGGALWV